MCFYQDNSTLLLTLKRWYLAWMVMTGQGTPFTMLMSPNRLSWCSAAVIIKAPDQTHDEWRINQSCAAQSMGLK